MLEAINELIERMERLRGHIANNAVYDQVVEMDGHIMPRLIRMREYLHTNGHEIPYRLPGVISIYKERLEQIEKHGFDALHDDNEYHKNGQLTNAAHFALTLQGWPEGWDDDYKQKIVEKSYINRLIVAGAFIAAEIDRLIRADVNKEKSDTKKNSEQPRIYPFNDDSKVQTLLRPRRMNGENEQPITYEDLRNFLNQLTPEQLKQKVAIWGENKYHTVYGIEELTDDFINPSGDGCEPVSVYEDDEQFDATSEPIVHEKGTILMAID